VKVSRPAGAARWLDGDGEAALWAGAGVTEAAGVQDGATARPVGRKGALGTAVWVDARPDPT